MSYSRVEVAPGGRGYEVVIGPGVIDDAGALIAQVSDARKVALLCDENVGEIYGARVAAQIARGGFEVVALTFPAGETSKTWQLAGEIIESLASAGLGRDDLVVALGGGVAGDLIGFAAASYLRGVDFVQIPTTLLAQVDSSVGGKTGVDLRAGKNLAGAFKQPLIVLADTTVLSTVPDIEWTSGLAEVAKSAIIDSEEFTAWLERNASQLMQRDEASIIDAVARSVEFKAAIVTADEREAGQRECLNYGHTLGHAIEAVAGYGVVPHGIAVAEGMRFAARLAVEVRGASMSFVRRQDDLLDALGLPFMPEAMPADEILAAMRSDKKTRQGEVRFVLAARPGDWSCDAVPEAVIRQHLEAWVDSKLGDRPSVPDDAEVD